MSIVVEPDPGQALYASAEIRLTPAAHEEGDA
jgi:hypothetical protein